MEYDYSKLTGRIIEKYGTRCNFASKLGVVRQTVENKLHGRTGFSRKDILKWSELLGIEQDDYYAYFFAQKV